MSYSELVNSIAAKTGLPKSSVNTVLKAFADVTSDTVMKNERVLIPGFGAFTLKEVKPRLVFGKMSEGRRTIRFKAHRRSTDGEVRRRAG